MTIDEINALSEDELLAAMRDAGLEVTHSMFATVHHRSAARPNGWTEGELDEVGDQLESADLARWRRELAEHFADQRL